MHLLYFVFDIEFKVQDGTTLVQPHSLGNVQQGQVIQLPAGSTIQQGTKTKGFLI